MNGSTAFHLKQIMSAEHLSLTQTAKQIGISPASMRKVLKDATMSPQVMFKINRFIDDHQAIIATKPGELPTAPAAEAPAAKPAAKKTPAKKAPVKKAPAKPAAKAKAAAAKPATKAKAQPNTKAAAAKPATKAKAQPAKTAAKQPAKAQAKSAKTTTAKAQPAPKKATKPAAKASNAKTTNTKSAKRNAAKQTPAKPAASKDETQPAKGAVQTNLTLANPTPEKQAQPAKHTIKHNKAARFTIHQIDGEPIVPEAVHDAQRQAEKAKTETKPAATLQQEVEARAEQLSQAGVGSMDPKPQAPKQPQPAAKPTEKPQTKQTAPAKPAEKPQAKQVTPAKPTEKPQAKQAAPAKQAEKSQAKQTTPAKPIEKPQVKQTPAEQTTPAAAASDTTKASAPATPAAEPAPSATTEAAQPTPLDPLHKHAQTLQLFVDESFVHGNDYQRNMFIGVTVTDQDDAHALDQFADTLYPFGWQPGDEVKARGKNHDQIAAMLTKAHGIHAANFVAFSPQSDTGNFALGFGVLYPYLATILRVLDQLDTLPNKVRIALDRRNELEDEQLAVAARMLNAYVKAQRGKDVMFMLRTSDSKSTIGIQYSDFSAHAALTFTAEQLAECGITRLPDLGSVVGDQITLFSMIGLQKYMLDDRSVVQQQASFKSPVLNAADRLFRLSNKATSLTQVPDETLTQAKLVINQLLQITPSSINGAINKMPFQTWYDMVARAAALLHYNDATLPRFEIDPDAMQIAQDALNNIANLLASAK